ncbi:MAG: DNA double-strand break repair nuclease NurA [Nitrososphaerales archaeon]
MTTLSGKKVFFRSDFSKDVIPLQNLENMIESWPFPYELKELSQCPRERLIVAVDSSCVLIGETEDGAIYAGRVSIVYGSKSKAIRYCRAGPIIFYLDSKAIQADLGLYVSAKVTRLIMNDRTLAERFIRLRLERVAQIEASKLWSDSIILVDGALKSSILEPKGLSLKELERTAEDNFNQILGISKATSIRFISRTASVLQSSNRSSVYLDITEGIRALIPSIESRVLLAKFSNNCPVFRVDSSYKNAEDESQIFSDLKYNDLLFRGYPETLRLAHHLSVFDASTVSSVRGYLSSKYGVVQIPSDDLRAMILGRLV